MCVCVPRVKAVTVTGRQVEDLWVVKHRSKGKEQDERVKDGWRERGEQRERWIESGKQREREVERVDTTGRY